MENLRNAFKGESNLKIIKRQEFDIYYSCTHKWPLLTVENINSKTGKSEESFNKNDPDFKNPWKVDTTIPKECCLSIKNFQDYMEYGGSNGHNVPAAHHKTNKKIYLSTYLLSNICPQEIVFNSGIWVLLEIWCKNLKNNKNLKNITVYTGSIPAKKKSNFGTSQINIPTHMFKIVTATHINNPKSLYILCFLMKNENPNQKIHKLYKHLVSLKELSNLSKINFFQIFKEYSEYNEFMDIKSMKQIVRVDLHISENRWIIRQMHASHWYGKIIYSTSLKELEKNWEDAQMRGFGDVYHETYYNLCKKRIKRENPKSKIDPDNFKTKKTILVRKKKSLKKNL